MISERHATLALFGALILGLLYRLHPIAFGDAALAETFVTEDGYLMLTVARNIAIGEGMTVSAGEIMTNGIQPLATLIYALSYVAAEGDKVASLVGVHLTAALFAVAAALALRAFARAALSPQDASPLWPLLIATLWFIGPHPLLHTMNGLETGLYTLMTTATVTVFGRLAWKPSLSRADQLLFGSLCGLTFLARIDGALLVVALFAVRTVMTLHRMRLDIGATLREVAPAGVVSLLWAAPWLGYNYWLFGSIMPISGTAQALRASFGANAGLVPGRLFETMFPMLPIPDSYIEHPAVQIVAGSACVGILAVFLVQTLRRRSVFAPAIAAYALFAAMIVGYYGFLFGAPHFVGRYFAPLSPLLLTAAVSVGLDVAGALGPARRDPLLRTAGVAAAALCVLLLGRLLIPGVKTQGHEQVVEWVRENVPAEAWVGAVQTGTLGYWHDRTINLDGKVNPAALQARREKGHVLGYVVASEIDYLADWRGIASWARRDADGFSDAFELIVDDPDRNLAVLRRRVTAGAPG
jgi:hypothetical protein